jgi:protein O-mannosyl-transferase
MSASAESPRPSLSNRGGVALGSLILVIAIVIAYSDSFSGSMVLDDFPSIVGNPSIRHLGSSLLPPSDSIAGDRPLLNLSFALNFWMGGLSVQGYHAFNLLIHVLSALALFGLVRRTLGLPLLRDKYGRDAVPLAAFTAVLWALHPLLTESVTYISQRAETLMGFFYLITLYCFVRGAPNADGRPWLLASILAFLLGCTVKETIATAPLLVVLYDRTFVAGTFRRAWHQRRSYYLGLFSGWLALGLMMGAVRDRGVGFGLGIRWWSYAIDSGWSLARYVRLAFWPSPLVFDYGVNPFPPAPVIFIYATLATLGVGLVAAVSVRKPSIGFIGLWFLIILVPTTSFVPLSFQPVAENRVYLSLASLVAGLVLGFYHVLRRWSFPILACIGLALGCLTYQRNRDYKSPADLWVKTAAAWPNNPRAHHYAGVALSSDPRHLAEAVAQYQEAVREDPLFTVAHVSLGNAYFSQPGRSADAAAEYEKALQLEPDFAEVHLNLGNVLAREPAHFQAAVDHYRKAIAILPDYAEAYFRLGLALVSVPSKWPEAKKCFEHSLRIDADNAECHYNLAVLLSKQSGGAAESQEHYRAAIRLSPNNLAAHYNLGLEYAAQTGHEAEAIAEFDAVLRIDPSLTKARMILEKLRAVAPPGFPRPSMLWRLCT